MSSDAIRVGIIGCGMITQRSHAPGFAKIPGVTIAALCDPVAENVAKVHDEHAPGAAVFSDYHDLLKSGLVEAVSVATPVFLHCPMALAALGAGCHVLCEKPMAMSKAETAQMVAAARKAGKVLQINLSRRYDAFYQTIAGLLADGRLGQPRHIRAIRFHTAAPDKGWSKGATWFVAKKSGGGIVGDIGVHVGDMMQWFFGEVESIRALTDTRRPDIDVVDNAVVLFRFRNGATGVLELSWTSPVNRMCMEIHGSEGVLLAGASGDGLQVQRSAGVEHIPPAQYVQGARNSFQCFADAVRGVAPTPVPGEVGHAIQLVLDAIIESGENNGAPVAIDRA